MRSGPQEKGAIRELGERSIRAFFFEHPMATYAAALAYRGLFGLFPFVLILVVLVGALGIPDFFDRAMDQARAQSSRYIPQQLEPVVEPAREQIKPLVGMIERAEQQAGGKLLFSGVAFALLTGTSVAPPKFLLFALFAGLSRVAELGFELRKP